MHDVAETPDPYPTEEASRTGTGNSTKSQLEIIKYEPCHNCILCVKAGPGSGKTYTLTQRIAHLIAAHEIRPEEILVLSMTNRSVISLRESLTRELGETLTSSVNLSTFHSFCAKLVDNYAKQYLPFLGERKVVDDLSWKYFSNIFSGKFVELNGQNIEGKLSSSQFDELVSLVRSGRMTSEEAAKTYKVNKKYVDMLVEYLDSTGMIRYNDLVNNAFKIMEISTQDDNSLIDELYRYKVVVVDEFQDMYPELLSIIQSVVRYPTMGRNSNTIKHLTIAGDPNQSIYDFLGSETDVMDTIGSKFPGIDGLSVKNLLIEECFRCTPEILESAFTTCLSTDRSLNQRIRSVRESGQTPVLSKFTSPNEEYYGIVNEIIRLTCESGGLLKLSDFLIMARSNKEVEEINRVLTENYGIKFNKLTSSLSWLKSKVSVLLNVLSVLERSSGSEFSLLCLLMFVDSDTGSKTRISKAFTMSHNWLKKQNFRDGGNLEDYLISNMLNETPKEFSIKNIYKTPRQLKGWQKIESFINTILNERTVLSQNYDNQDPELALASVLAIVENSPLKDYLNEPPNLRKSMDAKEADDVVFKYRKGLLSDLEDFSGSLSSCYGEYKRLDILETTGESFVKFFLKNYNEDLRIMTNDSVNTSTIHAAKGLEFPVVFIVGTSAYFSGPWSSILTRKEQQSTSSSRLLYVAMTRAKNLLYLGTNLESADISTEVLDTFTVLAPKINPNRLQNLSRSLNRPMPDNDRLKEGRHLFKQFNRLSQTRNFSTSSYHYIRMTSASRAWRPRFPHRCISSLIR